MHPLVIALLIASPADTLPVPDAYRDALLSGTRSRTGAPGGDYWQQRVEYDIRTRLFPTENRVVGSEEITYHNQSPDTLREIVLNLAQNVFAAGNPRNRPVPVTGGFDLRRVMVQGTPIPLGSADRRVGTVLSLPLERPLPPGASTAVEIDWSFVVPEGTFRMGREGSEVFYLAQWYPQIATYDDLRGWVRDPYLGDGEFYLDYGDFTVEVTAPAGWLVSGSGVLQNANEVLPGDAVARMRSLERGRVTHIVTRGERDAGRATLPGGADGTLTWRFVAENVRDFAWGSSNRYVWDGTVAEYPADDGSSVRSAIYTFYRPEKPNWEQSAAYARHAIETHSAWYPYPYPQMTVNEGVIGGGMEYPMITIIGGGGTPLALYGVISHELAHMWWPMVAGSDERNYAWMDEGMASFAEDLATPLLFPDEDAGRSTMNRYLRVAGTDRETESMRPADLYGPFGNRGIASYQKPATAFRALRTILGPAVFDRSLRTYLRRWAFKHPTPLDLFWTFEDVSGRDLDWFFYPWMYTTRVLDQGIAGVTLGDGAVTVVVEDRGEIPMPVIVEVVNDSGGRSRAMASVEDWRAGSMAIRMDVSGIVREVILDPEGRFPDVNREDNRWAPSSR